MESRREERERRRRRAVVTPDTAGSDEARHNYHAHLELRFRTMVHHSMFGRHPLVVVPLVIARRQESNGHSAERRRTRLGCIFMKQREPMAS